MSNNRNKYWEVVSPDEDVRPNIFVPIKPLKTPPPKEAVNNFESRQAELGRFFGEPTQAIFYDVDHVNSDDKKAADEEAVEATFAGNATGFILGWTFHKIARRFRWYQSRKSQNPLYRNLKTIFSVSLAAAMLVTHYLPFSKFLATLIAGTVCLVTGVAVAFPYWLIRQYVWKVDSEKNKETTHFIFGDEGWSKYGKTFFVAGTALGQLVGIICALAKEASTSITNVTTAVFSLSFGVGAFVLGMIAVPAINKISEMLGFGKKLKFENKETFRNNYARSGITLVGAIGIIFGIIIQTYFLPGAGIASGILLGGAAGSVLGAVGFSKYGAKITEYAKKHWKVDNDTDNSWDYSCRTTSMLFSNVGTAIGAFIPIPGSTFLLTSIFAVAGWCAGLYIVRKARQIKPIEQKAKTSGDLSWTQSVGSMSYRGMTWGMGLGALIGVCGGPLGVMGMSALLGGIGGLVGGAYGALKGKESRKMLKAFFTGSPVENPVPVAPRVPAPILSPAPAPVVAPVLEDQPRKSPCCNFTSSLSSMCRFGLFGKQPQSTPAAISPSLAPSLLTPRRN